MASTKKSLAPSNDVKALLKAVATGDTEGVDLAALKDFVGKLGLSVVSSEEAGSKGGKRVEVQRRWLTATELNDEERGIIEGLSETLGTAPIITGEDDVRDFSQAEIDQVAEELLSLRPTEDIVKGRKEALRATILNIVSLRNENDPNATGEIPSLKNKVKLVVNTQTRVPEPNLSALEGVVSAEVWEAITSEVTTRVVDEEKLAAAMAEGKVDIQDFATIVPEPKVIRTFTVKDIQKGDAV